MAPASSIEDCGTPFASWFLAKQLHLYRKGAPGSVINGIGEIVNKFIYKVRTHIRGFHPIVTLKAWQGSNLHGACRSSESLHSPWPISTRLTDQMWFESLIKAAWDSDTDSDLQSDQHDLDQYDETHVDFAAWKDDFTALTSSPEMETLPISPTSLLYRSVDCQVQVITGPWYPCFATTIGTKVNTKHIDSEGHSSPRCMTLCNSISSPEPTPHVMSLPSLDTMHVGTRLSTPVYPLPTHPLLELQKARNILTQDKHLHLEVGPGSLKHDNAKNPAKVQLQSLSYATDVFKSGVSTRMGEYERLQNQFRWRMIPSIEPLKEGIMDPISL
ncbi:uncharacterized protein MELLADRAFT_110554 [Melampsora larici-populina 98AG31]|uniref:Uncharacterized protein n=1 Tax=Melampsora larici-populina (strain 98AG31 / pathotype 3-4-7) TaxID=747676 RepID=F4S070_MELLP|nr:uncharacterized protein MELLADRAFT_110554 [Melampsora larici-populina 98AG31]EGG01909.1 hypothetical protein MELLADRAFT_110554 [Melampsora larici-populina 98AG31]